MVALPINIFNVFLLCLIVLEIVFGGLLLLKKQNFKPENVFLGVVLLIFSFIHFKVLLIDLGLIDYLHWLFSLSFSLTIGSCLYFYMLHITVKEVRFSKVKLLHFLPGLLEFLFFLIYSNKNGEVNFYNYRISSPIAILQILFNSSLIIYCFYVFKRVSKYYKDIDSSDENDETFTNLRWLKGLVGALSIIASIWLLYFIASYFFGNYYIHILDFYLFYIVNAILVICIGVQALWKERYILIEKNVRKREVPSEEIIKICAWLEAQMVEKSFYLNPLLNLNILSKALDINTNMISHVINEGLNKNFKDFVNEYRIREVVKKLSEDKGSNLTLLGIAFECGFNSKSTFNRVFKKSTGKTPLEFKMNVEKLKIEG
ncbi:MAG: helix-turn-helix domain-containing protein [Cellulophaga sp.]